MKAFGNFCGKKNNWLCFLEQITNCSIQSSEYRNMNKYVNANQTDVYLYVEGNTNYMYLVPNRVKQIVKHSPLYQNKIVHYWRIQAVTFLFRLNRESDIETDRLIYKSFKNELYKGCFNIWIRHGDKYREMKLLNSEDYIPSYRLFKSTLNRNIPIYLSTDDPNVTKYYDNLVYTKAYYLKFLRRNDHFSSNMKRGDEMTLNFIADIKASLYCHGYSGTRKSNVVRLIDELRSTIGLSANSIYFENGIIKFSDSSYEYNDDDNEF